VDLIFEGKKYTLQQVQSLLKKSVESDYTNDLFEVFVCALKNPPFLPILKKGKQVVTDFEDYIDLWSKKYVKGYKNRPSQRKGNPPSTIPDTVVTHIYAILHKGLDKVKVDFAASAHTNMMTIENIVGDILEEFLSIKLKEKGWFCCWGTTVRSVDFCHKDGTLLQIKTSDNSENSSSSAVRNGTDIKKWCRRKSKGYEQYYWEELQKLTGDPSLNEFEFRKFINQILSSNPGCVHIKNS
jgi:hypothetical protein